MRLHPKACVFATWSALAGFLLCLPVPALLRQSILIDDTYYALAAARHLAAGEGSTVDGLHRTNGYQPLWVWILAGVTAAGDLSSDGTVRAALILCAAATLGSGLLAAGIVRLLGGSERAGACALALWLLNPFLLRRQFNGLEPGLAALLLLATVRAGLKLEVGGTGTEGRAGRGGEIRVGVLAGLTALARLDLLILAPVLVLRRRWLSAGVAALLAAGWLAWSFVEFGSLVPLSGEATRVWYGALRGGSGGAPAASGPAWDVANVSFAAAWIFGLGWPAQALQRLGVPGALVWLVVPAALAAALLIAAPGRGARHRLREWWRASRPLALWSFVPGLFLWGAYSFAFPAPWHLNRYFLPLHALWVVWVAPYFDRVLGARPAIGGICWALVMAAGTLPFWIDTAAGREPSRLLDVARWIREEVPAPVRIGVLQSGIVGYYAGRPIANLDGKVNPEAMRALRDARMADYLERERIEIFGDWEDLVECCVFGRAGSAELRRRAQRISEGRAPPAPFVFYRLAPTPLPRAVFREPTDPRAW
jgi:hypothetical protein